MLLSEEVVIVWGIEFEIPHLFGLYIYINEYKVITICIHQFSHIGLNISPFQLHHLFPKAHSADLALMSVLSINFRSLATKYSHG
jgi:hypothetical protein